MDRHDPVEVQGQGMSDQHERNGGPSHAGALTSGQAGLSSPARSLEWCPGCGSSYLRVVDGEVTNFLCRECGSCWHRESDGVRRVDPRACPGCPSWPVCLRKLWEALQETEPAY